MIDSLQGVPLRNLLLSLSSLGLGIAMSVLLLHTGARPAYACSCAPTSVAEYVERADLIVVGTVSELEGTLLGRDVDPVIAVERYMKGSGPPEVEADDPVGGGDCGFFSNESLGQRYLVFLRDTSSLFSTFETNLCSGSTLLKGGRSLAFLGEVQAITGPGHPPDAPGSGLETRALLLGVGIGSILAAVVLIAASAFFLQRRRASSR